MTHDREPGSAPSGSDPDGPRTWDFTHRSIRTPRIAVGVAAVIVVVHVVFGALLRISDTGVRLRVTDQIGVALIGVVLGAAVLTLTRPRIRVGRDGVAVRNLLGERLFGWDDVRGISYPDAGRWARLELPDDENVPVLAIQGNDGGDAVAAMDAFRVCHERYGDLGSGRDR